MYLRYIFYIFYNILKSHWAFEEFLSAFKILHNFMYLFSCRYTILVDVAIVA